MKPLLLGKSEKDNPLKAKRARRTLKRLIPIMLVTGILLFIALILTTFSGSNSVADIIFSGNNFKSSDNRVNILLLGVAGGTHDGASLTDTIMVASYDLKTNQVYLFSIPRDLWLPALKSKSNAVYQIGLSSKNGLGLAKTVMGNILGVPIHYGLRVDFRGFIQAIDALEGIDVLVDKSFDDYNYPIEGKQNDLCGYEEKEMEFNEEEAKKLNIEPGKKKVLIAPDGSIATDSAQEDKGAKYFTCRYEHIEFEEGMSHMDGTTALKYVRSRHGTNGQGSDFARSKRQQRVLEAVRNKALSLETFTSPQKITDLISALGRSVDTDIGVKDGVEFYKLFKKINTISNFTLDDSPKLGLSNDRKSLLIHPPASDYGGAYVLISQDDDFSLVQEYTKKILSGEINEYEATAAARKR